MLNKINGDSIVLTAKQYMYASKCIKSKLSINQFEELVMSAKNANITAQRKRTNLTNIIKDGIISMTQPQRMSHKNILRM